MPAADHENWHGFIPLHEEVSPGNYAVATVRCIDCQQILQHNTKMIRDEHRQHCNTDRKRKKTHSHEHVNNVDIRKQQQYQVKSELHPLQQMANAVASSQSYTDIPRVQQDTEPVLGAQDSIPFVRANIPVVDVSLSPNAFAAADPRLDDQLDHENIQQLLIHICVFTGTEYQKLHSPIFRKFLECLNNDFTEPPAHNFNGPILKSTLAQFDNSIPKYEYTSTMVVLMRKCKDNSGYNVMSFIFAKPLDCDSRFYDEKECFVYVYVDGFKYDMIADEKATLNTFCDNSVKAAECKFGVKISFLMHEGIGNLDTESTVNDHKYLRFHSMGDIINALWTFDGSNLGKEFTEKCNLYVASLTNIKNNLGFRTYTIADGLEDLFNALFEGALQVNDKALGLILKWLSPFHLAANFLDYRYKGKLFSKYTKLNSAVESFVLRHCQGDALRGFFQYTDENGVFDSLFRQRYLDKNTFWNLTSTTTHLQPLRILAKEIINILAAPKDLDLSDINKTFQTLHMECTGETKSSVFSVLMNN
ncbi:hypothetical protein QAD02_003188 [Eretmocerus hayati]|uniref:Uncharacterized protein n=1 Tax=Eretmocerus hayati TaxID=131215 RepID=A0ACC2NNN7_9HYME|nr:hypothetical protein QAD02_003188 [Eretmocerus hayati]